MNAIRSTTIVYGALLALVLSGAWVSGRLVAAHDGGWRAGENDAAAITSPCGLLGLPSARCADVVESRWGSFDVYVGDRRVFVPASLIGLAYFVFLGVWLVMAPPSEPASRWVAGGWRVVTSLGLAGSVFYIGVMFLTLGKWCSACLAIHAINAMIFVGVWWSLRRVARRRIFDQGKSTARERSPKAHTGVLTAESVQSLGESRRLKPAARGAMTERTSFSGAVSLRFRLIGSACLMSVCAVAATWMYFDAVSDAKRQWRKAGAFKQAYEGIRENADLVLREFYSGPAASIGSMTASTSEYPKERPRIQVFTNFDSSACACFDRSWREDLLPAIGHAVPIEMHYLPQRGSEGPIEREVTESMRAARAAEAARMQGGDPAYAHMKYLLFAHRRDVGGRDYAALARRARLDPEQLAHDMASAQVQRRIRSDIELAGALGVTATPAVFVDGRRVPPLCLNSLAFWSAIAGETPRPAFGERVSRVWDKP